MTSRCKFGHGNHWLARVAKGTASGAIRWPELPRCKSADRSESEHECSTVRRNREGRAGNVAAKTLWCRRNEEACEGKREGVAMAIGCRGFHHPNAAASALLCSRRGGAASPVSRWWDAEKVRRTNLGDRMTSGAFIRPICRMAPVAQPISVRSEAAGDASCGVREAHSTGDGRDSITLQEGRGLAWCTPVHGSWMSPFPERGRRFVP